MQKPLFGPEPPLQPSAREAHAPPQEGNGKFQEQFWPHAAPKGNARCTPTNAELFSRLDADLFLANQLFRRGLKATVLEGLTTAQQRRERIRREILAHELEGAAVLGQMRGTAPETLAAAFERLYHEPLAQ